MDIANVRCNSLLKHKINLDPTIITLTRNEIIPNASEPVCSYHRNKWRIPGQCKLQVALFSAEVQVALCSTSVQPLQHFYSCIGYLYSSLKEQSSQRGLSLGIKSSNWAQKFKKSLWQFFKKIHWEEYRSRPGLNTRSPAYMSSLEHEHHVLPKICCLK